MASYYKLAIEERLKLGTSSSREMRRNEKIPGNYYYHGEPNQNIVIDKKVFNQAIQSGQKVFEVDINGETIYAMIKSAQYHPVTEDVIHVDLMRVRRTEKMTVTVPVILEGEAAGGIEGGLIAQVTSSIEIECFPTNVPENLVLDISGLELNSSMIAGELTLSEDIALVSSEKTTIVTCNAPKAEAEPKVEEVEAIEEGAETKIDGENEAKTEKGSEDGKTSE